MKVYNCDTYLKNFDKLNFEKNFFDIIVVDGFDRFLSFKKSLNLISKSGIFIFDNSEGYNEPRDNYKSHPILNMMNDQRISKN